MLISFLIFFGNFGRLLGLIVINRAERLDRKELFWTYLRIKLKYVFGCLWLKLDIREETIFGFKIRFFDYLSFISLFEEIFITQPYCFSSQSNNPRVIDAGSNIGLALFFFKKLYPGSKITAFEPDGATFDLLRENVSANNLKEVELVKAALSDRRGETDFYFDPQRLGSGSMGIYPHYPSWKKQRVETVLLSDWLREPIDFLKMDIEGAEEQALKELAAKNKLDLVREMVVEYHHHLDGNVDNLSSCLKIIEENRFGYNLNTYLRPPFEKKKFQDLLIYAYRR